MMRLQALSLVASATLLCFVLGATAQSYTFGQATWYEPYNAG
jgi:hypothetical protein